MFRFLLLSRRLVLVSVNIVGALIHCPILARWWTILPTLALFLMPLRPLLLTACAVSARPPQPSDPSSHFSPTNPSPLKGNCNYITRLFWQYCCTVLSHKHTLQPSSRDSTRCTSRFCVKYLASKSSYYHRVLAPSSDSCSNAFLARKAAASLPNQLTPSQIISQKRLQYLGHIMRHPYSLEHAMIFGPSHSFLRLSSPYRRGAPRAHWYELAFTEAYHRVHLVTMNQHPRPYEIHHPGYRTATLDLHKSYQGSHMPTWFDNTKQFRQISPFWQDRSKWGQLVNPYCQDT